MDILALHTMIHLTHINQYKRGKFRLKHVSEITSKRKIDEVYVYKC